MHQRSLCSDSEIVSSVDDGTTIKILKELVFIAYLKKLQLFFHASTGNFPFATSATSRSAFLSIRDAFTAKTAFLLTASGSPRGARKG